MSLRFLKFVILIMAIFTFTTLYCRTIEKEGFHIRSCKYTHSFEIYTMLYILTLTAVIDLIEKLFNQNE